MGKKVFIIDGNHFSNLEEFFNEAQDVLTNNFPEFGRNLDAINDILNGGFGRFEPDESIELIWKNADKSKTDLGYLETEKYLKEKLKNCHPDNKVLIQKELRAAESKNGPTLYDKIIEIMLGHKNVSLIRS